MSDPRAACFHARFTLEALVHWLYRHDSDLRMPYDRSLGALLHEPTFQNILPEKVFQKARVIQKTGNQAVHSPRPVHQYDALHTVKELHHICYWVTRTYTPDAPRDGAAWQDARIPKALKPGEVVPRKELEELQTKLEEQNQAALKQQQERDALDKELQALREKLADIRAGAESQPDPHDYSEAETRRYLIDVDLRRAGWPLDKLNDREYKVTDMSESQPTGYADYVLWGDDGKPLAVVEAKRTRKDADEGRQQAKLYADGLERMHGQRPVIFYTNGYKTWIWDDRAYPPRQVAGFYKKDELQRLILRRVQRRKLDVAQINTEIVDRYYQKRAIGSIFEQFVLMRRKALLVMATGTGKTRTAIALVDALQQAGWVKRALFLADRIALVKQAVNAFKTHLPESSPVNLVTEKNAEGRVFVCTYPTMLNLIDRSDGGQSRFGVGHFDLVIIDEAHRSVYQKYGAIFRYFDSLLVGLTATPRDEVDRNTYDLFELEPGVPTDAYELETAVADGFLVPPRVQQVDLKFPREGIDYDSLSDEEKAQWESLDWGDDVGEISLPERVNAAAVNSWLFNKDTVDKALQHLMEHGHKVEGGDRLAKTIIFARNHDHATFIEERFNFHYPHLAGHFARVIDNYSKYPQTLIDDFSDKDKAPHIAISVDMLDTGIDVPEVANLLFFKPVYSKIKFWQMIGRGTRLCIALFGPGDDKSDFRVFDFCFNFDFFRENPQGFESGGGVSLGARLFRARVSLLGHLNDLPTPTPSQKAGLLNSTISDESRSAKVELLRQKFYFCTPEISTRSDESRSAKVELLRQKFYFCTPEISTRSDESRSAKVELLQQKFHFCTPEISTCNSPASYEGIYVSFERLRESLTTLLHGEVASMNRENFIVRMHLETVEHFQNREAWNTLSEHEREILRRDVAGLPSQQPFEHLETRLFDLTVLGMQLAVMEGNSAELERLRRQVVDIAMQLEEKTAIPAVKEQLAYLAAMQETAFWQGITPPLLEEMRLRLRGLVRHVDRKKRKPLYTNFKDEVLGIREEEAVFMPNMTGLQYEKKVKDYLRKHLDHLVIHRLRSNQPLTATDLNGLERTLTEIGEEDGETLLSSLLERNDAPSLAWFVRSLVGMDRAAAQTAFSSFLNDRSLTPPQIRFVEMVIDQLTARGVMKPSALYEAPFSNLHTGGPDALFAGREQIIEDIFDTLEAVQAGLTQQAG